MKNYLIDTKFTPGVGEPMLRRILNVKEPDKISNEELWQKKQTPVEQQVKEIKWRWTGHNVQ